MEDKKHTQVKYVASQMMMSIVEKNKPEKRDWIFQGEAVPLLSRVVWEGPPDLCRFHHMAADNFEQGATQ